MFISKYSNKTEKLLALSLFIGGVIVISSIAIFSFPSFAQGKGGLTCYDKECRKRNGVWYCDLVKCGTEIVCDSQCASDCVDSCAITCKTQQECHKCVADCENDNCTWCCPPACTDYCNKDGDCRCHYNKCENGCCRSTECNDPHDNECSGNNDCPGQCGGGSTTTTTTTTEPPGPTTTTTTTHPPYSCSLYIYADPNPIPYNQNQTKVCLSGSSLNMNSCTIDSESTSVEHGPITFQACRTFTQNEDSHLYTGQCDCLSAGGTKTAKVTVTKLSPPCDITLSSNYSARFLGHPFSLTWTLNGDGCTNCQASCSYNTETGGDAYPNCGEWNGSVTTNHDSKEINPPHSGKYEYTLSCDNGLPASVDVKIAPLPWWREIIPRLQGFLRGIFTG